MSDGTRGDKMLLGRTTAGIELLSRTGVSEVELAYDDETGATNAPVLWWAQGNWYGTRVISEHFPYPAQAVEDLLSRVGNGGKSAKCGRTTVVGVIADGYCCFALATTDLDDPAKYRWVRSCEVDPAQRERVGIAERRRRAAAA